jgi:hypothetical protein
MRVKLLIGLFCLLFISCEVVQYDGETRFVTKGIVLNSEGLPLPNINVEVTNSISKNSNNFISYTSSIAKTNANGEFICISPMATNTLQTTIKINSNSFNGLSSHVYNKIQDIDYQNYKIELNKIILRPFEENVSLTINFVKTNNSNFDIKKYQLVQENQSNIVYNNPFLSLYAGIDNTNSNNAYFNTFTVRKNEDVILKYTKINSFTGETEDIEMPISILEISENITINL